MSSDKRLAFLSAIESSWQQHTLVKINLGNYKGDEAALKSCIAKPVQLKKGLSISFVYRYKTRDITKNAAFADAFSMLQQTISEAGFRAATLFTTSKNYILQLSPKGKWLLTEEDVTHIATVNLSHDHQKERKIKSEGKEYLNFLGITSQHGEVYKNAQDKYRQINHYIEILSSLLKELPTKEKLEVVDMGSGKGYLTFALYDYLKKELAKPTHIVGVEYREDMVTLCNDIAKKSGFDQLEFVQGTIENYNPDNGLDILIALHACDTATDDAIAKGISNEAELIVVAPCCHKQIRRAIEAGKQKNDLDFLLKHGIFLERQAEMVTDGIRALVLEYYGYATKVFQFISDAHTPKNVMIVAQKRKQMRNNKSEVLKKIADAKAFFGINQHYLETILPAS